MISDKIEAIKAAVNEQLAKSEHLQDVQDIRVKFLGKKGELTAIMKEMKNFSKEERPKVGQLVNTARNAIEEQLKAKMEEVKAKELAAKIESEKIDITLPGRKPVMGHEHPLSSDSAPDGKLVPAHGLLHRRRDGYRIGLL